MKNKEPQTLQSKYDRLLRIHNAANIAIARLHRAVDDAVAENKLLRAQAENAQKNVLQQKAIVKNHLSQTAEKEKELVAEIVKLRTELKAHGYHDKLGD